MKDARVETASEMEILMERIPESIRFSKVSNFVQKIQQELFTSSGEPTCQINYERLLDVTFR